MTSNLKLLILVAACNMAELGEVSREWERLTTPTTVTYTTLATSSTTMPRGTVAANGCDECGSPAEVRENARRHDERAKSLRVAADAQEYISKTQTRWRDLVRACFPTKAK